jgi:hypothetical protein
MPPERKDDGLFPVLPDDLKALTNDERQKLLDDHVSAAALIDANDEEFLAGLSGDEIIEQYTQGVAQIKQIREVIAEQQAEFEAFEAKKAELKAELEPEPDAPEDEGDEDEVTADETTEVVAEAEPEAEAVTADAEEKVPVLAAAPRYARRPPAPAPAREPEPTTAPNGAALLATGEMSLKYKEPLDRRSLEGLVGDVMAHHGPMPKIHQPGEAGRFGGPEHKIAKAEYPFPEERTLTGDVDRDAEKVLAQIPALSMPGFGQFTGIPGHENALVASGGICAPATPFYGMVNFATEEEPVWDSLPVFRAARGGVNVPTSTYIADITTAISNISADEDAQGGTFATKSCQALDCPPYTETQVQILAHCREYGNLNARTWPEKIAHENALTMAALARTSEDFMLEQIKALSINVTNGVETLGALIYLVDAIVKSKFGIAGRFRMPRNARFTALLPSYTLDLLLLDTIQTQFDRFKTGGEIDAYLRSTGIDPVYYIDGNFAAGDDQLPDAAQTAAAIDGFPNTVQWALFPQGAFLGIDSGVLELGIVRDSVLNSTNDFQVFGERFRNVVRLAPAQAAYWITTDWCPSGQFPPAGTARTCE